MMLRFHPLFRAGAWFLVIAGFAYLYLGTRSGDQWTLRPALVIVGVAAIAVGTALLRWFGRASD